MSKRVGLIRRWALIGSAPVLLVAGGMFARSWLTRDAYVPDGQDEGITRSLARGAGATGSTLRFTDVTDAAGIDFRHFPHVRTGQIPEDMGPGVAWGDYDGDGLPDVFLVNFASPVGVADADMARSAATDRLFRNRGDGSFEDVTAAAGVGRAHRGMGAAWADIDGDGDVDLFVTSWGVSVLWENLGNGTFRDVSAAAGIGGAGFWTGASWADFDRDGDIDLYVCGYVDYRPEEPGSALLSVGSVDFPFTLNPSSYDPLPNRLYVNRGDGTFDERAASAGVADPSGKGMSAAWTDLDEDGWLDLYVANDVSDNRLFRNLGDGTFEDVSYAALVADYRGAMGIGVGDWDGDLDQDLFITHWVAQENALYSSMTSDLRGGANAGRLNFGDQADRVGLGQVSLSMVGWGTAFADFDTDGSLDLFVVNGSTMQQRTAPQSLQPQQDQLYWNRGATQGFFEVGREAGFSVDPPMVGRGAAVADFDRDGDLDVLVMHVGGPAKLFRNDSEGGHWAGFVLRSTTGHASAIGAKVTVFAGGRAFIREVGAGPSYLSQHDPEVHVGLGDAEVIDSVRVVWQSARSGVAASAGPGSQPGVVSDLWIGLQADRRWLLVEGTDAPTDPAGPIAVGPGVPESQVRRGRRTSAVSARAIVSDVRSSLTRDESERFWALHREGTSAFNGGRWEVAAEAFQGMLALDARHEDARYDLGNALLELGRYGEAIEAWRTLLDVNPVASRALVQLGVLYAFPETGHHFNLEAAREAFAAAHDLNPEESRPLVLLAEVEVALGNAVVAERWLSDALGMNDRATSPLYLRGYLAWKRGDATAAARWLNLTVSSTREAVSVGAAMEGDTRSDAFAQLSRKAAQRRLFAVCLTGLADLERQADPARDFACVDEELSRINGH